MRHTDPHTKENAQESRRPRKRIRVVPYVFGNDRLDELLWSLLDDGDPQLRAYVYRMEDDRKITPALFNKAPYHGLIDWLRDEHRGGHFHIIIRRGKRMELSGIICIGVPLARQRCR